MSFSLLFYRPAADPPIHPDDLEALLLALPGVQLDGAPGAAYRPGRWTHAATGASAVVDLGEAPLEQDELHPARAYDGWTPLPLTWQIPLSGPHWHAVEAFTAIEDLLAGLPGVRALDVEDVHESEGAEAGPFAWNRPRLIASWESQRRDRCTGLAVPAMARGSSLRLWRYRREWAAVRQRHPDLAWPEALVLHDRDSGAARPACLRPDAGAWALPPVELVVVGRGAGAQVVEAAALAGAEDLPALARRIAADAPLPAAALPPARFRALQDGDWRD